MVDAHHKDAHLYFVSLYSTNFSYSKTYVDASVGAIPGLGRRGRAIMDVATPPVMAILAPKNCQLQKWSGSYNIRYKTVLYLTRKAFKVKTLYYCNLLCYRKCSTSLLTFEAIAWTSNTSFKWVFFTECLLAESVVPSWVSCWDSWWPWGQSSLGCSQEDASLASMRELRGERGEVGMRRVELVGGLKIAQHTTWSWKIVSKITAWRVWWVGLPHGLKTW